MKGNAKNKQEINVKGKLEKILWACLIVMFIIAFFGMFIGKHMDGAVFYKICIQMTVFSSVILSLERFYFGKEMGRDMPQVCNITYWLIILWAIVLVLHFMGVNFLDFLMTSNSRTFWVIVPTASLLWETRYIFGDNLDWDNTDKYGWKEGRMNYSQNNKKNKKDGK